MSEEVTCRGPKPSFDRGMPTMRVAQRHVCESRQAASETSMINRKPIIESPDAFDACDQRHSALFQHTIHQTVARIGGTRIVVNLHENARPPTAAAAQNQIRRLDSRNRQNSQNITVVPATKGSSIVDQSPGREDLGLEQTARPQVPLPWTITAPAPGNRDTNARSQIHTEPRRAHGKRSC